MSIEKSVVIVVLKVVLKSDVELMIGLSSSRAFADVEINSKNLEFLER